MKSLNQLQSQYNIASKEGNTNTMQFLRPLILYLELKPKKGFVLKMRTKIEARIQRIDDEYEAMIRDRKYSMPPELYNKGKTKYRRDNGVPRMRKQLKGINYLLD